MIRRAAFASMLGLVLALGLLRLMEGDPPARAVHGLDLPHDESTGAAKGFATELHVCPAGPPTCDYSTVQDAVDAAASGDVIKVAEGAYTDVHARDGITQVVYISKTLTIQGGYTTSDWTSPYPLAHATKLDARQLGRVMVITGTISPTVAGLHLTGGDATGLGSAYYELDAGGGLYVLGATAVISGNAVFSNSSPNNGGGIALYESPSQLINNTVTSNTAGSDGGGVALIYSAATLNGNVIIDNAVDGPGVGGGLAALWSDATVDGNDITRNSAWNGGGGVEVYQSNVTLRGNTIKDNTCSSGGGGIELYYSDATLADTVLAGNRAWAQGGGLYVNGGSVTVVNSVIRDNTIDDELAWSGAGVRVANATCRLRHTTIVSNSGGDGSGVYADDSGYWWTSSYVEMTNTIVASHTLGIHVTESSTATLNATLWHANQTRSTGNVIRTKDVYGDPGFAADGYHLTLGSAAIERGVDAGVTSDIDGDARPQGAHPDIGADELPLPSPDVEWEKWVSVNSGTLLPWDEGPFTVSPGDTVNITDRVRVSSTWTTALVLADSWSSSLVWQDCAASTGDVSTSSLTATWNVTDAAPDVWHTLQKTFLVQANPDFVDALSETLTVQGAAYQPPARVIAFQHNRPRPNWDKMVQINDGTSRAWDSGPFIVKPGDTMTVTDRVSISHTSGVSFTVRQDWGPRLQLVGWTSDAGAMVPGTGTLRWQGVGAAPSEWHQLTAVFNVLGPAGAREWLTQTLEVAAAASQLPQRGAELLISGLSGSCAARTNDGATTYGTVQEAVDAAGEGELVKVAGTCTGVGLRNGIVQVVYLDKGLTIQGGYTTSNWTTPDPVAHATTLDAQGLGRGMVISGSIAPTVAGLRIEGGKSDGLGGSPWDTDSGGGLLIQGATAVISGNVIYSNSSPYLGGGVFIHGGASHLVDNTISGNTSRGYGGGVYLSSSSATLKGNTIHDNHATSFGDGGGIDLYQSPATLDGNTITGNSARNGGGGVGVYQSDATLVNNVVDDNTSYSSGGGLQLYYSDATLRGNLVTGNTAGAGGAGLYVNGGAPTLVNNVVADNTLSSEPNWRGAGILVRHAFPSLLHTTIARNAGGDGSGIHISDADHYLWTSDAAMTNTIIFGHSVGILVTEGNTATLHGTLWYDNATDTGGDGTILTGTVNVYGDPAFASDGYHLTAGSTAIDAGVDAGVTTDIDGHERPYGEGYDVGADEAGAARVFLPLVVRNQ
ncbi:MAG: choice-of-anchor Q domain-containing protein [Anaerolineae bacterium]|jgi:parallel beta-helix repeat protein